MPLRGLSWLYFALAVISLQIVMVSPGTHLGKNHESQSRITETQFTKQWVPGSFVTTHLIWRQTLKLCITIYWSKNILPLLQSTTKTKRNKCHLTTATRTKYFGLWGFLCFRDAGYRGNKITALGCNSWLHQPFRQPFGHCVQCSMCYQVIVSLCNRAREERRWQTVCDNNFVWKTFYQTSPSFKQIFL